MRALFDCQPFIAADESSDGLRAELRVITAAIAQYAARSDKEQINQILGRLSGVFPKLMVYWGSPSASPQSPNGKRDLEAAMLDRALVKHIREVTGKDYSLRRDTFSSFVRSLEQNADAASVASKDALPLRIYIPSLRGLRPLPTSEGGADVYKQRTISDYFEASAKNRQGFGPDTISQTKIFTGLSVAKQLQHYLLGEPDEREAVERFQQFLQETFFGGQPVTLMPKMKDDFLSIRIGDEERPVYELGDGIQQVIILTLPMFLHRDKSLLLFIEEPELFLHPGFQRIFVDTVMKKSGDLHQVFIATHSHQFLDITMDEHNCSVYRVSKSKGEFSVDLTSAGDFTVLEQLGVRNSSVFLSNCTIWVEGITDRLYLKKYLDLYQTSVGGPTFKEDLHYSFVEYQGGNITHWSFLDEESGMNAERLCGRAMVITDADDKKKREARHDKLQATLGDRFVCLPCREIENLVSAGVLRDVIKEYEKDSEVSFREFNEADYELEYLGKFIEDNVLPGPSARRGTHSYSADSGTIKDKVDFCHRVLLRTQTLDDMTAAAKEVAKRIYEFIANQNN